MLGEPDPLAMMAAMPASILDGWIEYHRLEPFGPVQEDRRAGHIASLFYNANRGRWSLPLKPADFFPSLRSRVEAEPEKTIEQCRNEVRYWFMARAAFGGKILKAEK